MLDVEATRNSLMGPSDRVQSLVSAVYQEVDYHSDNVLLNTV